MAGFPAHTRRLLGIALVLVLATALATAPALADASFPEVDVGAFDQQLGHETTVWVEVTLVQSGPEAYSIAVATPASYDTSPIQSVGRQLGDAEVDAVPAAGGQMQRYLGNVVVTDPAAFAGDAQAQACVPGQHTATWRLILSGPGGSLTVPVAVDQADTTYRLTTCLAPVHALGLKTVDVYFKMRGIFRNPTATGVYRWSALVTPTNATGGADTATVFELRADERLPQTLSLKPSWNATRKTLTLRGALSAAGSARTGIHINLYGGSTDNPGKMKSLGTATTAKNGTFIFTRRLKVRPTFVFAYVNHYYGEMCDQPSTAPGGCASETQDGAFAGPARVKA